MTIDSNSTIYLKDYCQPDHFITETQLDITLGVENTTVRATHIVARQNSKSESLILHCELMNVEKVIIDGSLLPPTEYQQEEHQLIINCSSDQFTLEITNSICPEKNTALSGLYRSGDMLCTQCEAEGFRRITPSIDRPDNLATYTVTLKADQRDFPVLLCNGNLVDDGKLDAGQFNGNGHFTTWHDPFPKPTYLFAVVAGRLECLEDQFITQSGRQVALKFFARDKDIDKCHHAMSSLKKSMLWDEQVYGREYDLDVFHVVAVGDFNMGAMENKSLNIFNTKYVLADSAMATDTDFQNVEGVIGHEYFHNWSGNRVTCRDWFQLSLKEGFTVFRDQEFSADMGSRGVKRIDDVNVLRVHQFKEDGGPMAHPVRPASYQEINNFYTATVYNKGAEVVRMLHTLLGKEKFRKGCDLYFETHDGQAVTTDDFVSAMESAAEQDLTQFKRWYSQAGTPEVTAKVNYNEHQKQLTVSLSQRCPPTPDQDNKTPFVIPVCMAVLDRNGNKMTVDGSKRETTLVLQTQDQCFKFDNVEHPFATSLLRGFSAPVHLKDTLDTTQLAFLLSHDDDPFNRWEAGQKLYLSQIQKTIQEYQSGRPYSVVANSLNEAFLHVLNDAQTDPMFTSKLITLPEESYVAESMDPIDPAAVSHAIRYLKQSLAQIATKELFTLYHQCQKINTGKYTAQEAGARALRGACLKFLIALDTPETQILCFEQLDQTLCMTDSESALSALVQIDHDEKQKKLDQFYEEWKNEPLVIDKWFRCQATATRSDTLERVKALTQHPGFDHANPNKVYSLIASFTHRNPSCFHNADGTGYDFLEEWIRKLDPINPQVASRVVSALSGWKKFQPELSSKMYTCLQRIATIPELSKDVAEIVNKSLS